MEFTTELGFTIAFAIVMILALVGNLLLIYIVWNTPETRGLTSFLFVNMAVADLLVAVIQMPLSMAHFYSTGMTGVAGDLFCKFFNYLLQVSMTASILSLVVMAFDRYFAVIHPLRRNIWFRRSKIILPVIWVPSCTLMAVNLASYEANYGKCFYMEKYIPSVILLTYLLVINYVLPLAIISYLYIKITRKIWFHEFPGQHEISRNLADDQIPKKKVLRTLIIVVLVFAVCWLPMQVLQMDYVVTERIKWHPAAIYFASWLSQANSAINPWLYILLNGKMNGAFRRMIRSQSVRSRAFSNTSQSTTAVSFLRNDCLEDTAV